MSAPIDPSNETLIALNRLPLNPRPHTATAFRWADRGCRGVKLVTCRVGGRRYTTAAALSDFVARLSAASTAPTQSPSARAEAAGRELESLGA